VSTDAAIVERPLRVHCVAPLVVIIGASAAGAIAALLLTPVAAPLVLGTIGFSAAGPVAGQLS
jgi:hypothetical protein